MTPGSSKEPLVQGLDGAEELHLCEPQWPKAPSLWANG